MSERRALDPDCCRPEHGMFHPNCCRPEHGMFHPNCCRPSCTRNPAPLIPARDFCVETVACGRHEWRPYDCPGTTPKAFPFRGRWIAEGETDEVVFHWTDAMYGVPATGNGAGEGFWAMKKLPCGSFFIGHFTAPAYRCWCRCRGSRLRRWRRCSPW